MEVWSSSWQFTLEWLFNLLCIKNVTHLPHPYCICYLSERENIFFVPLKVCSLKVNVITDYNF